MNIFGIGLPEMAVIAAIGLLVFGPKRLPELGKTLGRTLKGFQSASSEFEKEFRSAIATVDGQDGPSAIAAGMADSDVAAEAGGAGEPLPAADLPVPSASAEHPASPPA
jgi:sec-independent protein translocase protein TatA